MNLPESDIQYINNFINEENEIDGINDFLEITNLITPENIIISLMIVTQLYLIRKYGLLQQI